MTTEYDHILFRRNTAAQAAANNVILMAGEKGHESDTGKQKTGDGMTHYNDLPYDTDPAVIEAVNSGWMSGGATTLRVVPQVDSAAFRIYSTLAAAIAAAGNGVVVRLDPTAHTLPAAVTVSGLSDVRLDMSGATLTIGDNAHTPLAFSNCSRLRITGGRIIGDAGAENTSEESGLSFSSCDDVTVDGVHIESVRYYGITNYGSTNVRIRNCFVKDTKKDGIHTQSGAANFEVTDCFVINSGDDGIAVVSYQSNGLCSGFTITGNQVKGSSARGISIVGGTNGIVSDNLVDTTAAAGIMVLQDSTYTTYGVSNVTVSGNEIINPAQSVANGGIHVSSADALYPVDQVRIVGNTITGGDFHSIYLTGGSAAMTHIDIRGNTVSSSGGAGVYANNGNELAIERNRIISPFRQGILVAPTVTGHLSIAGNWVENANTAGTANVVSVEVHGDLIPLTTFDENTIIDSVGNTTYPAVFYAGRVLYGDMNAIRTTGTQPDPAFASGAQAVVNKPLMSRASASPTTGTWDMGAVVWNTAVTANAAPGWVNISGGTFGTLSGVTASTTSGSPTVTVSNATGLAAGQYISIAGVTGTQRIKSVAGTTVTLWGNANATVSGATVAYVAPVFRAMPSLIMSGTATLDFPSIPAGGQAELTIGVNGSTVGMPVYLSPPASLEAGLIAQGRVTASGVVTVRLINVTAAAIDPASASWRASVIN